MDELIVQEKQELEPLVSDEGQGGLVQTMGDDFIGELLKAADRVESVTNAFDKIINTRVYRKDWISFGSGDKERYSVTSAGAERLLACFPFKFSNYKDQKETWEDNIGVAYRYVIDVDCELWGSVVRVTGTAGTRDKFHGFAHNEWKHPSEINESNILKAAKRAAHGNGIKTLLGLRQLPPEELDRIYKMMGKTKLPDQKVTYDSGLSEDDAEKRTALIALLQQLSNGKEAKMKDFLKQFSLFEKDGKEIFMQTFSDKVCKGKWLSITLNNAKAYAEENEAAMGSKKQADTSPDPLDDPDNY